MSTKPKLSFTAYPFNLQGTSDVLEGVVGAIFCCLHQHKLMWRLVWSAKVVIVYINKDLRTSVSYTVLNYLRIFCLMNNGQINV